MVPPLLFETALSKIEQWGAQFINAAIADPDVRIDDESRVLFSIYMAMQYVRGRHFRAVAKASATGYFKLKYGQLTEKGIRHVLPDRGLEIATESIAEVRRFADDLNTDNLALGPSGGHCWGFPDRWSQTSASIFSNEFGTSIPYRPSW